jgi:cell filamentation protein
VTNEYQYDDPDSIYTDPATGVLRNKPGIADAATLVSVEALETAARLGDLERCPVRIKTSADLLTIHRFLFTNLYAWAQAKHAASRSANRASRS